MLPASFLPVFCGNQATANQPSPQGILFPRLQREAHPDNLPLVKENLDGFLLVLKVQDPRLLLLAKKLEKIRQPEVLQRSS